VIHQGDVFWIALGEPAGSSLDSIRLVTEPREAEHRGLTADPGSSPVHAEREQNISAPAAKCAVAGADEDHSARNNWAGSIDRAAGGFHAVDGFEFTIRVELP